MIYPQFK